VVFTSSSVGRRGRAYWGAYAVSKFATEGLMQVLADEHETAGRIRFNSLNPGATRTAMRAAAYPGENPAEVATPEQKMDLYVYLFEAASRGVNGQALEARDWPGPDA
jgi:NAD(P)-dependent dehydrogenase (short-subunit alcohol dehydrogenase family)